MTTLRLLPLVGLTLTAGIAAGCSADLSSRAEAPGADAGPKGVADADGDGFSRPVDCDDSDASVHPLAEEALDGEDNDCDGLVDVVRVCDDAWAHYERLQSAIDGVEDGMTIRVCPGTWSVNPSLFGRELTIRGLGGPERTVLISHDGGSVFTVTGGSDLTLIGFTITGGEAAAGGGLYCRNASVTLRRNIFRNHVADNGGAIYGEDCDVDITGGVIEGSEAEDYGGGVHLEGGGGTITDVTVRDNLATYGGGISLSAGDYSIRDSEISGNNADWAGGGIYSASDADIIDSVIEDNEAVENGGGFYVLYNSPTISGNTVRGNYTPGDGGGGYLDQSSALVQDNTFTNNMVDDDGGGLRIFVSSARVFNNTFSNNSAVDDGGGIKFSHYHSTFSGNVVEDNIAGDAGGGLELDNDTTHVGDNLFVGNSAYRGGGIHSWQNEGPMDIEHSTFIGNSAYDCGGAAQFDNNFYEVHLHDLWIEGNSADDGGGLCSDDWAREDGSVTPSNMRVTNTTFVGNVAGDDGGALYVKLGTAVLQNFVFYDNEAADQGPAAALREDADVSLNNGVIIGHEGEAMHARDDVIAVSLRYSDFYDNDADFGGLLEDTDWIGLDGNIAEDPRFTDAAGGDFSLSASSPCIDAGDPVLRDVDGTRSDMGPLGGPTGS